MTLTQSIITIAAVVLGTMLTRFLPFLIFPEGKKPPQYITYLGMVLPHAVIGLLVVYCLKDRPYRQLSCGSGNTGYFIYRPAPQMEKEHTHEYRRRYCIIYVSAPKLFSLSLSLQTKTGAITK